MTTLELIPPRQPHKGQQQVKAIHPPGRRGTLLPAVRTATTSTVSMNKKSGRPDLLVSARYERPSKVLLTFADGLSGTWSFQQLELDMVNMNAATITASASENSMEVRSRWNELVEIDASSLRAMVDPAYKAELDKAFIALRGPLEELIVTAPRRQQQTT